MEDTSKINDPVGSVGGLDTSKSQAYARKSLDGQEDRAPNTNKSIDIFDGLSIDSPPERSSFSTLESPETKHNEFVDGNSTKSGKPREPGPFSEEFNARVVLKLIFDAAILLILLALLFVALVGGRTIPWAHVASYGFSNDSTNAIPFAYIPDNRIEDENIRRAQRYLLFYAWLFIMAILVSIYFQRMIEVIVWSENGASETKGCMIFLNGIATYYTVVKKLRRRPDVYSDYLPRISITGGDALFIAVICILGIRLVAKFVMYSKYHKRSDLCTGEQGIHWADPVSRIPKQNSLVSKLAFWRSKKGRTSNEEDSLELTNHAAPTAGFTFYRPDGEPNQKAVA